MISVGQYGPGLSQRIASFHVHHLSFTGCSREIHELLVVDGSVFGFHDFRVSQDVFASSYEVVSSSYEVVSVFIRSWFCLHMKLFWSSHEVVFVFT